MTCTNEACCGACADSAPSNTDQLIADLQQQLESAKAAAKDFSNAYIELWGRWNAEKEENDSVKAERAQMLIELNIADATLRRVLGEANSLRERLARTRRTIGDLLEDVRVWQGIARRYADKSSDRLKVIKELDRRLNESWWTKFVRWCKGEWEADIYNRFPQKF
jgi:chromosome segregation ATPase